MDDEPKRILMVCPRCLRVEKDNMMSFVNKMNKEKSHLVDGLIGFNVCEECHNG